MTVRILTGDSREILKTLPDNSVHCVVTSPPYWGLRDYGVAGQLGMERSLGEYLQTMVSVFAGVKRVLRHDGTLWLNLGDSYAATPNGRSAADIVSDDRTFRDKPFSTVGPVYVPDHHKTDRRGEDNPQARSNGTNTRGAIVAGGKLKPKDLCGIPWRVAFALQDDGWWLRQDIIWSKPNPMPESIKDRCTKAHEYIFLMAKSRHYYFDNEAIAEPMLYTDLGGQDESGFKDAKKYNGKHKSGNKQRKPATARGCPHDGVAGSVPWEGMTRNKRSVWEIPTAPFTEAHFATFPPALVEPCILAGCPVGGSVLDPFGGAGTTGMVADRLGRNAILIELNPVYAQMATRRIQDDAGMFAKVAAE